ncbi:kinase-like domain-containing protein [Annulohypoxylon bovei var. microspora]|nr:kinase-like domain-containing protein [Annulohypoxylon bovei var. microspora]
MTDECIKGFKMITEATNMPKTYNFLCLRLQIEQQRFLNFGLEAGILYADGKLCDTLHVHRPLLASILAEIKTSMETFASENGKYEKMIAHEHINWDEKDHTQLDIMDLLCLPSQAEYQVKGEKPSGLDRVRNFGQGKERMKQFVAEIEILKWLNHHRIVKFVGNYTDSSYMGLIMSPVAEMNLSTYLEEVDRSKQGELRTFFGCLCRALEFLHGQEVRHKDIKPANILVHCGKVLFTDFGLSLDFKDAKGSTTTSMVYAWTQKYGAPEVAAYEPRNTQSDIWSLGVVFLEMIAVLKGKDIEEMDEFFEAHGSGRRFAHSNHTALLEFITELKKAGRKSDNVALAWVQQMLEVEPQLRPTASKLVGSIIPSGEQDEKASAFCGICCSSLDDSDGDDSDTVSSSAI